MIQLDAEKLRQAMARVNMTGRLSELTRLRPRDIHTTPKGPILEVGSLHPTKGNRPRTVPIPHRLARRLGRPSGQFLLPARHPMTYVHRLANLTEDLPPFGQRSPGATGNRWHLLRSTYAVMQARRGVSVWELMRRLGHRSPQTTMRYVALAGL